MRRIIGSFLLVLVASTTCLASEVQSARNPDLRPLLFVQSYQDQRYDAARCLIGVPPGNRKVDTSTFIGRGGAVFETQVEREYYTICTTRVAEGIGSAASLGKLQRALALARAGLLSDCELRGDPEEQCEEETSTYRFVWHGKGRRVNEFTISLIEGEPRPESACPAEVRGLLEALLEIRGFAATRFCSE